MVGMNTNTSQSQKDAMVPLRSTCNIYVVIYVSALGSHTPHKFPSGREDSFHRHLIDFHPAPYGGLLE